MRALEVMNGFVVRASPSNLIGDVARAMRDQGVGLVCVCDDDQVPIGVVTDRDITVRVCAAGVPVERTEVRNIMSPRPITCGLNTSVDDIHLLMRDHGIARVLVVDDDQHIAGVVSLAELWHYESPLSAGPVSRRVTERELRVHATGGSGASVDGAAVGSAGVS